MHNSFAFYIVLSHAILPTFRFRLARQFIRLICFFLGFFFRHHFRTFDTKIVKFFNRFGRVVVAAKSNERQGDNSDGNGMLLRNTADSRMRMIIEEC